MFLNKFFHFSKGYVILLLTGSKTERFICMAAKNGLKLHEIKREDENAMTVCMSFSDFLKIRPVARKTRTHVRIKSKAGLPVILKKLKMRRFFLWGAVLFAAFMIFTSRFVWKVEIIGVKNAELTAVEEVLKDAGVYVGAPKRKIKKSKEIKNTLINRVDNITWAWVYLKGTKVVCEICEDSLPPVRLESGEACNIIAAKDGIIKRITVTGGIKKVATGDTVCAGDLLISGVIFNKDGNLSRTVEAEGIVEAKTWHEKKCTVKLYNETEHRTGRKKRIWRIKLFSAEIPLQFGKKQEFEKSKTSSKCHELTLPGGLYTGIALTDELIEEVSVEKTPISYDMAVYGGKCGLEEEIAAELCPGAELVSENLSHRQLDGETAEVTLTMEFTERIGISAPIGEMQDKQE